LPCACNLCAILKGKGRRILLLAHLGEATLQEIGPRSEDGLVVALAVLLHVFRNLTSDRSRGVGHDTQQEKGRKRTQIQTKDGRNETTKQIQVGIRNGKDGLQDSNTLRLGKPTKQDASRNDNVVNAQKSAKTTHKDLFGDTVSGNRHGRTGT
jgi:hypothetical protein